MNIGNTIKKTSDGNIIQKIEFDKLMTFWASCVSWYNHIIANKEVKGIEVINPPIPGYFLLTVDIIAMIMADTNVFTINCTIEPPIENNSHLYYAHNNSFRV